MYSSRCDDQYSHLCLLVSGAKTTVLDSGPSLFLVLSLTSSSMLDISVGVCPRSLVDVDDLIDESAPSEVDIDSGARLDVELRFQASVVSSS